MQSELGIEILVKLKFVLKCIM